MTALAFPSSPALYQRYTVGAQTWYWDGITWRYGVVPTSDPYWSSVTFLNHLTASGTQTNLGSVGGSGGTTSGQFLSDYMTGSPVGVYTASSVSMSLVVATNSGWAFGTGDFTINFRICPIVIGVSKNIMDFRSSSASVSPRLTVWSDNSFRYSVGATDGLIVGTAGLIVAATWYELELARVSGTTRLFVNGVLQGSPYTDSNSYVENGFTLGNSNGQSGIGEAGTTAIFRDARITKGVGRHTASFSYSPAPFPNH